MARISPVDGLIATAAPLKPSWTMVL